MSSVGFVETKVNKNYIQNLELEPAIQDFSQKRYFSFASIRWKYLLLMAVLGLNKLMCLKCSNSAGTY